MQPRSDLSEEDLHYAKKYGWEPEDFPTALSNYNRMVSLPLSPKMRDQDVADVIEAVQEVQ